MFSIPLPKWAMELILSLVALLLFILGGWLYGRHEYNKGVDSVKIAELKVVADTTIRSSQATNTIISAYVPTVGYIKQATITLTKQVPIYVTKENDNACTVPNGFVQLWNATNKMQLPTTTGGVDAVTSNVVLSDIATQHAIESGLTHADEAQVKALQDWILAQQAVYNK